MALPVITEIADRAAAREPARQAAATMLSRPQYAVGIARLGYPDDQIAAVSDELVDVIVAHDLDAIATVATAHRAAGADHVILMPSAAVQRDLMTGVGHLERLAPALLQVR